MSQKRYLRILSYEGTENWMNATMHHRVTNKNHPKLKTFFTREGTVKEIHLVELKDDESLNQVLRRIADETR